MGSDCLSISHRTKLLTRFQSEVASQAPITSSLKILIASMLPDHTVMFDYQDERNIKVESKKIFNSSYLVKYPKENLKVSPNLEDEDLTKPNVLVYSLKKVTQGYLINKQIKSCQEESIWERISEQWSPIQVGQIFKTGQTTFTLKKIIIDQDYIKNQYKSEQKIESMMHIGDNQCRICLDTQYSENNPLISPCECLGSVQYIHLRCLKQWLFVSESQSQDSRSIDLKKSKCQICKASLLQSKVYQNIIATILSGNKQLPTPFAVFEGLHIDKSKTQLKNYFIYSFRKKNKLSIGRGSKVEMRTDVDKSISRLHAQIKLKDNQLLIRDCGSRYGTTKKLRLPFLFPFSKDLKRLKIQQNMITIFYERKGYKETQKYENKTLPIHKGYHKTVQDQIA